ncbi:hypothetical protein C5S39_12085 [Candidatus Methanophagaceae archaeon]|jgi:hypothetical protein|nr:hypothetical protein C5S39_12085 [Methanophagales archaeon]
MVGKVKGAAMDRLLSVEAVYDGEQIKMPGINIHRPCKVIITFLEGQSEEEEILDVLLREDPAFEFLKSEDEDLYTDDDLIERFE